MKKAPCQGCSNRSPNCHSICDKYIEYDIAHKKEKEEIRKAKEKENLLNASRKRSRH